MTTHESIVAAYATYLEESAKFEDKGVKAAAARARAALGRSTRKEKFNDCKIINNCINAS